jgi:hypothetical protein
MTNRRHGESSWNSWCVGFFYEVLESVAGCLARLGARVLQTEFLFTLDLDHLSVVYGDFHGAKSQIAQGALDLTQDGGFVLTVNAT